MSPDDAERPAADADGARDDDDAQEAHDAWQGAEPQGTTVTMTLTGGNVGPFLFVLFVVLPLVELALLLYIGDRIGWWITLGIVLGTGFLGAFLARIQGARAWREIVAAWQEGRVPGRELVAGALFLVGAAFLLTPGVLTDATGFLLMVPLVRSGLARTVLGFFKKRAKSKVEPVSRVVRVRKLD